MPHYPTLIHEGEKNRSWWSLNFFICNLCESFSRISKHSVLFRVILPILVFVGQRRERFNFFSFESKINLSICTTAMLNWYHMASSTAEIRINGVVSKETVVLRRWESIRRKFAIINWVHNIKLPCGDTIFSRPYLRTEKEIESTTRWCRFLQDYRPVSF